MFKIKIEFFRLFFVALLLLATNTTGFDIYFHAISVADFGMIDYYNPAWVVSGYELPRYIFLHYFLWLSTCFGLLPLMPVLGILYALALMKAINHKYTHGFIKYAVVTAMVVNIIFTSALGISLLVIGLGVLARAENKRSKALFLICLGSVLHPIGFVVGFLLLLVLRGWLYLLISAGLIHLAHSLTLFIPSYLIEYQRVFDLSDLLNENSYIYEKVVNKLSVEALALFALVGASMALFAFGKIFQIRLLLNSITRLVSVVNVNYVIYFLLAAVIVKSYPSHLTTGGPLAVITFQYEKLPRETLNIISSAWVSPYLLQDSIKLNQYSFRGD